MQMNFPLLETYNVVQNFVNKNYYLITLSYVILERHGTQSIIYTL